MLNKTKKNENVNIDLIDNRYQVELPFKENIAFINDNYANRVTRSRLISLKKKLDKNAEHIRGGALESHEEVIRQARGV